MIKIIIAALVMFMVAGCGLVEVQVHQKTISDMGDSSDDIATEEAHERKETSTAKVDATPIL